MIVYLVRRASTVKPLVCSRVRAVALVKQWSRAQVEAVEIDDAQWVDVTYQFEKYKH